MAVCIIPNSLKMFNENRTFFEKKLATKTQRRKENLSTNGHEISATEGTEDIEDLATKTQRRKENLSTNGHESTLIIYWPQRSQRFLAGLVFSTSSALKASIIRIS